MSESRPAPTTVEECRSEAAAMGLRLERIDSPDIVFSLRDLRNGEDRLIDTFRGEFWTELECAQAALRFARYFLSESDSSVG